MNLSDRMPGPEALRRWRRTLKLWVPAWIGGRREAAAFRDVERFCLFVGSGRSGHSLVGSLLDAHPDVVIGHEVEVLRHVQAFYGRDQLFWLLLDRSRRFARQGSRNNFGYAYAVPGQWQGRYRRLRVIGDKRAGTTTQKLRKAPELLDRLRRVVGVPLRVINVVRNPYDVVATMSKRDQIPLERATHTFFNRCEGVVAARARLADDEIHTLRHEDFLADPRRHLAALCGFLGVDPEAPYLDACAGIVRPSPHQSRLDVTWPPGLRDKIERRSAGFGFLDGYGFDDDPAPAPRRRLRPDGAPKVFGIGFQKTGTKSLGSALEMLGYRVRGPVGIRSADIAGEVIPRCLRMVADYDAFQDNPWPILYRELDQRFPGSKFILTVRPSDAWLASVLRHFTADESEMRRTIYGVANPRGNEDVFVRRYERHNADVMAHFRDRPGDLLVLRLTEGEGWDKLCPFLGCEAPDAPFPVENTAGAREAKWARLGRRHERGEAVRARGSR